MAGTLACEPPGALAASGNVSTPAITDFSVGLRRTSARELLGVRASKAIAPVRPSASVATGGSFAVIAPARATQTARDARRTAKTKAQVDRPKAMLMRAPLQPPASVHPRKSIRAPVLAADPMM